MKLNSVILQLESFKNEENLFNYCNYGNYRYRLSTCAGETAHFGREHGKKQVIAR